MSAIKNLLVIVALSATTLGCASGDSWRNHIWPRDWCWGNCATRTEPSTAATDVSRPPEAIVPSSGVVPGSTP